MQTSRINQPGTASSPRFETSAFESTLPPEALEELRGRSSRRPPPPLTPVTPVKSVPPARDWRGSALAILGIALVAAVIVSQLAHQPARQVAAPIAIAATPAPPLRVPAPSAPWPTPPSVVEVRRALPVPVPRAELVDLPAGTSCRVQMPSGEMVVRYMGTVGTFDQLPSYPQLGDMYGVRESLHSWVWCVPSGWDHAVWQDP